MIKKKYIFAFALLVLWITALKEVYQEKKQQEAIALTAEDVFAWLNKHRIDIPAGLEQRYGVASVVLDVIASASHGIDSHEAMGYKDYHSFVFAIQRASGFRFD